MEAAPHFREVPPAQLEGAQERDGLRVVPNPSQSEEGVFLSRPRLPEFETTVHDVRHISERETPYGFLERKVVTMSDGEVYPTVTCTPNELRSDTAIVASTAWLTTTKGHNLHTALRMVKLGYPVKLIGPEGEVRNHELSRTERFQKAKDINLFKVVHDMNQVLSSELAEEDLRPDEVIVLGESRGAMTGFGFDVSEYSGNRRMAYGDLTAPCFARPPKLGELPGIAAQLVPELITLSGLAFRLFGSRLRYYPATLHADPEYYAKELFKVPDLMSGQAGKLAAATSKDTPMHIKIFEGDRWSQADAWEGIFANHPQVTLEPSKGYHLAIAEPATLQNIEKRLSRLAEIRGFDGSFQNVNFREVVTAHQDLKTRRVGRGAIRAA